ncbi:MAG: energy transducer TonB [Pseudomonadota bacterium]
MDLHQTATATELRPSENRTRRLIIVAIPAGAVTLSLFAAMQSFIKTDDVSASALPTYDLLPYIEAEVKAEPREPTRKPPRPKPLDPPPQSPKLINSVESPDLPTDGYIGVAPADYGAADLDSIKPVRASAITVRDLQPLTPPVPVYPRAAIDRGLEGTCEVHLDVSIRGEPINVAADCSDRSFERAAKKAVEKVKFAPQIRDGLPVMVTGVIYPLEFQIKQ